VDLVIVEEDTLKDIIERFVKWRKSVLKEEAPSKVEKEKCNETEGIQNNKIVHKTKREQILLSQPYTSSKIIFNSS